MQSMTILLKYLDLYLYNTVSSSTIFPKFYPLSFPARCSLLLTLYYSKNSAGKIITSSTFQNDLLTSQGLGLHLEPEPESSTFPELLTCGRKVTIDICDNK